MVPTALFDSLVIVSVRAAGRYVNLVGEGQGILESLLMEQVLPQVPTILFEFIGITLGGLFHLLWVFYFFAAVVCNGMYVYRPKRIGLSMKCDMYVAQSHSVQKLYIHMYVNSFLYNLLWTLDISSGSRNLISTDTVQCDASANPKEIHRYKVFTYYINSNYTLIYRFNQNFH